MGYLLDCCFCGCGTCEGCRCLDGGNSYLMDPDRKFFAAYCNSCGGWWTDLVWTPPSFPGDACRFQGTIALVNALTRYEDESGSHCACIAPHSTPLLYGPIGIELVCGASDASNHCNVGGAPCDVFRILVIWTSVGAQQWAGPTPVCTCNPLFWQVSFDPTDNGSSPDECSNPSTVTIIDLGSSVGNGPPSTGGFVVWRSQCDQNGQNCTWTPILQCGCTGSVVPPGFDPTGPNQTTFTPC